MKLFRLLCAAILFIPVGAKPVANWLDEAKSRVVTEVLPNGLTVVCYPMPGQIAVRVGVTYDAGSKDELSHEHGYAHMVEHMIFKGTDTLSETDIKTLVQTSGVGGFGNGFNATTSQEATRYYFNTDTYHYATFLEVLSDCMFNMRCDENHFVSKVKTVINEIYFIEILSIL